MKVFLSWSGDRSKEIAEALKSWLPQVIQATEPWISSDIEKGTRWSPKIVDELEKSKVGIICLTRENLNENWILFEAGALSKTKDAHVCTFLLGVKPSDIEQPLAQFQHTQFEKEDVRKLIHTINQSLEKTNERPLSEKTINEVFDTFWPKIEEKLEKIVKKLPETEQEVRTEREILEEILESVRRQEREKKIEHGKRVISEYLRMVAERKEKEKIDEGSIGEMRDPDRLLAYPREAYMTTEERKKLKKRKTKE